MKNKSEKHGMTLVEMLLALVILLVLITLTATIGKRIELQSQEKLTTETINIIVSALSEFADFEYQYKDEDYRALKFPVDCNGFENVSDFENVLENAIGGTISIIPNSNLDPDNSSCEAMYFLLNMVPASRAVLDKIDQSLVSQSRQVTITAGGNSQEYPLLRIVDAWGTTLHYSYYYNGIEHQPSAAELREPDYFGDGETRPFPVITSAGRDTKFGTDDDITSR